MSSGGGGGGATSNAKRVVTKSDLKYFATKSDVKNGGELHQMLKEGVS